MDEAARRLETIAWRPRSPFESNRDFFEGLGLAQGQQPRRSRSAPPAAVLSAEGTEKAKAGDGSIIQYDLVKGDVYRRV